MPTAVLVSQGEEIVTGITPDTNARWIAAALDALGISVLGIHTVGDHLEALSRTFADAIAQADLVISTGGLGPTLDDLTLDAIALACGCELLHDPEWADLLRARYHSLHTPMPESNLRQARKPAGAERLDNPLGTAPGWALPTPRGWLYCLPGPPHEMKPMFCANVAPRLPHQLVLHPHTHLTLRLAGLGESALQDILHTLSLPEGVVYGTHARTGLVDLHVRFEASCAPEQVQQVQHTLQQALGSAVYALCPNLTDPPIELIDVIATGLRERGEQIAVAESCTGGRIAAHCTAHPGASAWFLESVTAYTNPAKVARLGVPQALLDAHTAVSEPVARAMAEGIRRSSGSAWGLATTGYAGPGGGCAEEPVGTVFIALASASRTLCQRFLFKGPRESVQRRASITALDLLRRSLLSSPSPERDPHGSP